jgi:hypothetical protein
MCMSSPKMPAPPAPPPEPQEAKAADINSMRRKQAAGAPIAGGTLLTGPAGVQKGALTTTGGSLLGG